MVFFSPPERYMLHGNRGMLAEHLGYRADDKLLIINADDFGLLPEINHAVVDLFEKRKISSTTLVVPSPHYDDALRLCRQHQLITCGVHLTLTSDYKRLPLQPVSDRSAVTSLLTEQGCFHFGRDNFFAEAIPQEAEIEAIAQIEKALGDGLKVSHLDSHEGTLQLQPEYAEIYLRLASKFNLPVRMGSRALLQQLGLVSDWIDRARRLPIQFPDNLVYLPIYKFTSYEEKEEFFLKLLDRLPAGVTELFFHPAIDSASARSVALSQPESRQLTDPDLVWQVRTWDYKLLLSSKFSEKLQQNQIKLINFELLRKLTKNN